MAKFTVNGMVIEGSVDELFALASKFGETGEVEESEPCEDVSEAPVEESPAVPKGYVKVDRKGKAGDLIRFTKTNDCYLTIGKFYEVVRVDSDGDLDIIDDSGDDNGALYDYDDEEFEVFEKARTVNVGATVKVTKDSTRVKSDRAGYGVRGQGLMHIGSVGIVIERTSKGIYVKFDEDQKGNPGKDRQRFFLLDREYEVMEEVEVAKPEREYQVGDIVRVVKVLRGSDHKEGDIGEIIGEGYKPNFKLKTARVQDEAMYVGADEIELVAPVSARVDFAEGVR